jgi:hypothetical protein
MKQKAISSRLKQQPAQGGENCFDLRILEFWLTPEQQDNPHRNMNMKTICSLT